LATSEHVKTSANQRQQIADIDFVTKNSKQRAMTLKSDPHQPLQTTTHIAQPTAVGGRRCGWSAVSG